MYGMRAGQLFIDEFPLMRIKSFESADTDITADFPKVQVAVEMSFSIQIKENRIRELFKLCFGKEPYFNIGKCSKCTLKKECVIAKINSNFNDK